MIGIAIKGRGFRGLLNYLAGKPGTILLGGDMAGTTPRELAREFGQLRQLRPKFERAVFHLPLRAAPGESLTEAQWMAVAQRVLVGTGYGNSPYVVYLHRDTDPHVHIVTSRIDYDGRPVSDSNDYFRVMDVLREVERDYGLRVVPSRESGRTPPGKAAYKLLERTGEDSVRERLQRTVADAAAGRPSMSVFLARLRERGIEALPNVASTGRVSGISYRFEGYTFKGSTLGPAYSWRGLQDRLHVRFEPDQDIGAVVEARARALQDGRSPAAGHAQGATAAAPTAPSRSIAPPPASPGPPRAESVAPAPESGPSGRALAEVSRHLGALDEPRYHVLILDPARGRRELRANWTPEQIDRSLSWLRAENARGAEILVRPSDPARWTMLSGIEPGALERARKAGFEPAAAVRIGERYEVWLHHGRALSGEERAVLIPQLARHLEVEPRQAPADYGHLAGFASHLARRESSSERPLYASVTSTSPDPFPRATEIEARAARLVEERQARRTAQAEALAFERAAPPEPTASDALARLRETSTRHEAVIASAGTAATAGAPRREDAVLASERAVATARADLARLAGRPDLPPDLSREDLASYLSLRDRLAAAERRVLDRETAVLASPGRAAERALEQAEIGRQALHRDLTAFERSHGLSPSSHVTPGFRPTPEASATLPGLRDVPGPFGEQLRLERRAAELRLEAERLSAAVDNLAFRLASVERLALERPALATLRELSRLLGEVTREDGRLQAVRAELQRTDSTLRRLDLERMERSLLASPSAEHLRSYARAVSETARTSPPPPAADPSAPQTPLREAARRFLEEPTPERILAVRSALFESAAARARQQTAGLGRELGAARRELRAVNRELLASPDPSPALRARWSQALARHDAAAQRWAAPREARPISPDDHPRLLARVARGDLRPETVAALRRTVVQELATRTGEPPRPRPEPPAAPSYREAVQTERRARAALLREARSVTRAPEATPRRLARLESRLATYQAAAADVAQKAARVNRTLSPRAFLERPAYRHRPDRAMAAWAAHAARRGVSAERIGATLAHGARSRFAVPRALTGAVTYTTGWAAHWAAAAALRQVPGVAVLRRLHAVAKWVPAFPPSPPQLVVQAGFAAYSFVLRHVANLARRP